MSNENSETSTCNLGTLLVAKDAALVTLVVGESQLAVHRAVLAAKSPVFAAMLSHDMVESSSGRIVIEDIELEVLQQLVLYMYQDCAPELCSMAPQLVVAADKYCMPELKAQCELQLVQDLSVENVMACALLAFQHSCPTLKESAVCFIQANLNKIMNTEGWAEAVRNNPKEFVELSQIVAATPIKTRIESQEHMDKKLFKAAETNNHKEVQRLLVQKLSYVGARDVSGKTALHYAAGYGCSIESLKYLLDSGADMEARDVNGRTALHYASTSGYSQTTDWLLKAGAHVGVRDRWLQTPLHAAIQAGNKDAVLLLVAAATDVNITDMHRNTPLHLAAERGDTNLVNALLDAGANKGLRNYLRETPLDVAERCYRKDLPAMLR